MQEVGDRNRSNQDQNARNDRVESERDLGKEKVPGSNPGMGSSSTSVQFPRRTPRPADYQTSTCVPAGKNLKPPGHLIAGRPTLSRDPYSADASGEVM